MSPREASFFATSEIGLAVSATTLAIVVIFIPVAFMKGIIGRFFFQFGLTVVFCSDGFMVYLLYSYPYDVIDFLKPHEQHEIVTAPKGMKRLFPEAISCSTISDGFRKD